MKFLILQADFIADFKNAKSKLFYKSLINISCVKI